MASAVLVDSAAAKAQAWISSGSEEEGEGGAGGAAIVEVEGVPRLSVSAGGGGISVLPCRVPCGVSSAWLSTRWLVGLSGGVCSVLTGDSVDSCMLC